MDSNYYRERDKMYNRRFREDKINHSGPDPYSDKILAWNNWSKEREKAKNQILVLKNQESNHSNQSKYQDEEKQNCLGHEKAEYSRDYPSSSRFQGINSRVTNEDRVQDEQSKYTIGGNTLENGISLKTKDKSYYVGREKLLNSLNGFIPSSVQKEYWIKSHESNFSSEFSLSTREMKTLNLPYQPHFIETKESKSISKSIPSITYPQTECNELSDDGLSSSDRSYPTPIPMDFEDEDLYEKSTSHISQKEEENAPDIENFLSFSPHVNTISYQMLKYITFNKLSLLCNLDALPDQRLDSSLKSLYSRLIAIMKYTSEKNSVYSIESFFEATDFFVSMFRYFSDGAVTSLMYIINEYTLRAKGKSPQLVLFMKKFSENALCLARLSIYILEPLPNCHTIVNFLQFYVSLCEKYVELSFILTRFNTQTMSNSLIGMDDQFGVELAKSLVKAIVKKRDSFFTLSTHSFVPEVLNRE